MSLHFFAIPALDSAAAGSAFNQSCAGVRVVQPVWAVVAPLTPAALPATQHTLNRVSKRPALNRGMGATLRGEGFHHCRTSLAPRAGRGTEGEGLRSPGALVWLHRCTALQ